MFEYLKLGFIFMAGVISLFAVTDMVTLERALFDTNEALHHMGILPQEKSITIFTLSFVIALTVAMLPLIEKGLDSKYSSFIVAGMFSLTIYLLGGFMPLLIALMIVGSIEIIYTYPQYREIRAFIEKFI